MNLKNQEEKIHQTRQQIWLQNQYLTTLKEQQAAIFAATPETKKRTGARITEAEGQLSQLADQLARQTAPWWPASMPLAIPGFRKF